MKTNITFFGTSNFSIFCLEEMKNLGIIPTLIVTSPDKPVGRKLILQPNPVKTWAIKNNIKFLTPTKLDSDFTLQLTADNLQLFLVASYGKIIPKKVLDLPKYGVLNIHPSLLPKYRGPSPLQAQILNSEREVGVSLMLIDEQMDHGSLLAQEKVNLEKILNFNELEEKLAQIGTDLFVKILPDWLTGKIKAVAQNHSTATFTKKIEKTDGELDIVNGDPYQNYLKFLAYADWPGTYFFIEKNHNLTPPPRHQNDTPPKKGGDATPKEKLRVLIKDAEFTDSKFNIKKVLPEGKKEMNYADFLRGLK